MPQRNPVLVAATGEFACGCAVCVEAHPARADTDTWQVAELPHPPECTCHLDRDRNAAQARPSRRTTDSWIYGGSSLTPEEQARLARAQIHNYSYRPDLVFHGEDPHGMFYGMELEITTSDSSRSALVVADHVPDDLTYLKQDGSVRGFELVTHPLSYDFWMSEFPWELLPALKKDGCRTITDTNGIHVHVSRDGFRSPAHAYSWMKLWYRNPSEITQIAGRESSWGSFSNGQSVRKGQLAHVMNMEKLKKAGETDVYALTERERRNDTTITARYNAINTTNIGSTFEVRVFAATLSPHIAKGRLQLVAASVEYTRTNKLKDLDRWAWPHFCQWVQQNEEKYPDLAFRMQHNRWRRGRAAERA
jgi:hypothetical protein